MRHLHEYRTTVLNTKGAAIVMRYLPEYLTTTVIVRERRASHEVPGPC
jgi:hypothetical protein